MRNERTDVISGMGAESPQWDYDRIHSLIVDDAKKTDFLQYTAYNIDYIIPSKHSGMIWREKVYYEFLEPGKSLEEHVIVH